MAIWWDGAGDFRRLDKWIARLDDLIVAYSQFPNSNIEWLVAYTAFAVMYFRIPQHPMVDTWRERAMALAGNNANLNQQVLTAQMAVIHDLLRGDNARAGLQVAPLDIGERPPTP